MAYPSFDTNLLIRFLTNDVPELAAKVGVLLQQIEQGSLTVAMPDTVIADAVFVFTSRKLYGLPRPQVQAMLTPLVRLRHLRVQNRTMLLRALAIFGNSTKLDFGDCCIIAHLEQTRGTQVFSFDHDFDKIPGITRIEP